MDRIIIKICFVFLLMMMSLTNLGVAIKTQEELLDSLDLESLRVVLRGLHASSNHEQFDLLTEFPADTPHRMRKAQHVREVLLFIFKGKIERAIAVWKESSENSQAQLQGEELSAYQNFLSERRLQKERKYEERITSLEGTFKNSVVSEFISEIMTDFVFVEEEEESEPQTSPVAPAPLVAMPLTLAGSSSTAEYPPEIVPSPLLCSPSASSDVDEDPESLHLRNESENREELLLALDERDAKITLQAMLKNNYLIPRKENGYERILAHLSWVLLKKSEKTLLKKINLEKALLKKINLTKSNVEQSKIKSNWYDIKCAYYQECLKKMWDRP